MAGRTITLNEVSELLRSRTRSAFKAAEEIPVNAASIGYQFLVENAAQHVYSGGFLASCAVGVNDLPPLDPELALVTDVERRQRHNSGDYFDPPDVVGMLESLDDYEIDDTIYLGSDLWYAGRVDGVLDHIITEQTYSVVQNQLAIGALEFNQRSEIAERGAATRRARKTNPLGK